MTINPKLYDTYQACRFDRHITADYLCGEMLPNYPVPAIPVSVGWQPKGSREFVRHSYWWIVTEAMLWTCWSNGLMVVQRADTEMMEIRL